MIGLGVVGLWSALDAFAERAAIHTTKCRTCSRPKCLSSRLMGTGKLDLADETALNELEDVRHLYAHNYAGHADGEYFNPKWTRHVLASGVPTSLASGAMFDGTSISLNPTHLRFYADQSHRIIVKVS